MLYLGEDSKEKKKITITVADNRFTVLSSEDEEYSRELARQVDDSIRNMCASGRSSVTAAAILTAINYRDEMNKKDKDIEQLKKQLVSYFEDIIRAGAKNSELEKENRRLKKDAEIYRRRLCEDSPTINENAPISPAIKRQRKKMNVSDGEEAADVSEEKNDEENSNQIRWNI